MKKLLKLAALVILISPVYAADDDTLRYGPIHISSAGTKVGTPKITFNTLGTTSGGARNCITDISMSANNFSASGFVVTVLDGGTTSYQLGQSTGSIIKTWYPKNPLCLSPNTSTYLTVSGGDFKLNVSGYEKK